MVKRLLSIVALVAMTVMCASAMKAVHLEANGQWTTYGLSNQVPFSIEKYVGYKIKCANIKGRLQVTMGSVETHEETVSWSETPQQISDKILYIPLADGVNEYTFGPEFVEAGCTGVRNFEVQAYNGEGDAIDILEVILITPEGEEVVQDLGVNAWDGGAYKATELPYEGAGEDPVDPSEPDPHGEYIAVPALPQVTDLWDTQFFFTIGEANALKDGDEWEISFDIKAENSQDLGWAQWHKAAGEYKWWNGIQTGMVNNTWKTCTGSGTATDTGNNDNCVDCFTIAFNLSPATKDQNGNPIEGVETNTFYFDNISFKVNGVEKIVNGDLEGTDYGCFLVKVAPDDQIAEVTTGIESVKADNNDGRIYNIMGIQVDENYKGLVIKGGKKYIQK